MVTALYRRYRPENFAELIGQSQVTDPLRTALRTNRVNHAYLFSGPRGCGKTTSARILARCLNCAEGPTDTPCGVCPSCVELARGGSGSLDVIEIDAASHNGVDDARDLRDRAVFAPARDRYKIFILDEAHMVTPQGFNALLKLVEEPPEHVKFIFATTEPEKVIGTIRSRTHHYPFRLVPPAAMLEYVEQLCTQESVTVDPGVLPLVVRAGGGSVRDTLSLLDQLIAGSEDGALRYERAVALLGYTDSALLDDVVDALAVADPGSAFAAVDRVVQTGQDPRRFVEDLLERLRDLIVVAATNESAGAVLRGISPEELDTMSRQAGVFGATGLSRGADIANRALTDMTGATSPRLHLELMVARMLVPEADDTQRGALARVERLERRVGVGDAGGHQAPAEAPTARTASQPARTAPARVVVACQRRTRATAPAGVHTGRFRRIRRIGVCSVRARRIWAGSSGSGAAVRLGASGCTRLVARRGRERRPGRRRLVGRRRPGDAARRVLGTGRTVSAVGTRVLVLDRPGDGHRVRASGPADRRGRPAADARRLAAGARTRPACEALRVDGDRHRTGHLAAGRRPRADVPQPPGRRVLQGDVRPGDQRQRTRPPGDQRRARLPREVRGARSRSGRRRAAAPEHHRGTGGPAPGCCAARRPELVADGRPGGGADGPDVSPGADVSPDCRDCCECPGTRRGRPDPGDSTGSEDSTTQETAPAQGATPAPERPQAPEPAPGAQPQSPDRATAAPAAAVSNDPVTEWAVASIPATDPTTGAVPDSVEPAWGAPFGSTGPGDTVAPAPTAETVTAPAADATTTGAASGTPADRPGAPSPTRAPAESSAPAAGARTSATPDVPVDDYPLDDGPFDDVPPDDGARHHASAPVTAAPAAAPAGRAPSAAGSAQAQPAQAQPAHPGPGGRQRHASAAPAAASCRGPRPLRRSSGA